MAGRLRLQWNGHSCHLLVETAFHDKNRAVKNSPTKPKNHSARQAAKHSPVSRSHPNSYVFSKLRSRIVPNRTSLIR